MDTAYKNAAAKRDEVTAEINRLQQHLEDARRDLEKITRFMKDWEEFAGASETDEDDDEDDFDLPVKSVPRRERPNNPKREDVVAYVTRILVENGHPMRRAAIHKALLDHGVELEGTNPEMVLSTMLWRSKDKIVRLGKFGYWLVDEPYREADYYPPITDDIRNWYTVLCDTIDRADVAYHTDHPTMPDSEYDNLVAERRALMRKYPEIEDDIES